MSSISKPNNNNTSTMLGRSSIYLYKEVQCNQISVSNPTRLNKIFNTEIEVKKRVLCYHCGTSWLICILCKKRFSLKHKMHAEIFFPFVIQYNLHHMKNHH